MDLPTPRHAAPDRGEPARAERLASLSPLAAALDLATVASGLGDTAARESVARLLARAAA